MSRFCWYLQDSIFRKFPIETEVFVSKRKKKIMHIAFEKPLMAYYYFDEIIRFIEYWLRRNHFFLVVILFILAWIKVWSGKTTTFSCWKMQQKKGKEKMVSVLDGMYEDIKFSVSVSKSFWYIVKVLQVKKPYVWVRTPRGKILGLKQKKIVWNCREHN